MTLPRTVRVIEVGPRDGLQNEASTLPVATRIDLIKALGQAGLRTIEAGSFVSAHRIPQLADTAAVLKQLDLDGDISYPVLVPNMQGFTAAREAGAREIAVFAAASETFSHRNINCSVAESIARFEPVIAAAQAASIRCRGYVSCVLGCPYEGDVPVERVAELAHTLFKAGCYEISLGDTTGIGTPLKARTMVQTVADKIPLAALAVHFHDTYGMAMANIFACLEAGVSVVDASIAGLGGCPYAPGASGNVATEDLVTLLDGMGIRTGIDREALLAAGRIALTPLGHSSRSKFAAARNCSL